MPLPSGYKLDNLPAGYKLDGEGEAPKPPTPPATDHVMSNQPAWYSKEGLKIAAGHALDLAPTVGGIVGGTAGAGSLIGTGPGAIVGGTAGAVLGGEAGEAVRQLGKRALYGTGPETSSEAATEMTKQGILQGASELTGRVASKALLPATRYLRNTAIQSEANAVRLLPSEAHGEASSYLERFLKGSVITSGKMDRFRIAQNEETKQAAERVANTISTFSGSREQLGKAIQSGIDQHVEQFRKIQNQMYAEIDKDVAERTTRVPVQQERPTSIVDSSGKPMSYTATVMQKKTESAVMPSTRDLKEFAIKQLRRLQQEEKILDPNLLSRSKGMLQTIINAPDKMSYQAISSARSDALSTARELEQALAGKEAGMAKKIAELFDQSMMKAAKDSGIPGLPEKIRAANAFTANEHRMFEQALVKKVVETKKPEAIATFLRGKDVGLEETRDLFSVLPANLRQPVQKQVIVDAMRESTNTLTGAFNERKFAGAIAKIGEERGKEIFGSNWKNVHDLAHLMGSINGPTGMGGGSGAALQNFSILKNLMIAATPLAFAEQGRYKEAVGTLAGEWATLNVLALAMTHPETAVKMLTAGMVFAKTLPYAVTGAVTAGPKSKKIQELRDKLAPQ